MRWKHRIRIGKGNSMKVQLYLGYSVLLAFLAGLIGVFLFLGMRTLVMNQIGQSRLDVLKQVSERSNIVKNSVITISNLYRYDERVLDCLESDKRNFVEEASARRYLYDLKRTYDRVFHDVGMTYEIVILGNNGFQYFSYAQYDFEDLENQLWYRKSYDSEDDIVFVSSFLNKFGAPDEKEGYVFSAFRRVLDKDGKVVKSLAVSVTASSKLTNVTLGNTAITISKTASVDNKVSVKAVDQYNNDITTASKIILSGATSDADKAISATCDGNDVKVVATAAAEAGKTYTVKVEVKNGDVTINRYFTVKVVKTNDDVTKASDLRLEVSGVKDGKVDMAVADDADAEKAAKNVTVRVAAYDAGAKIGYVDNATYEINNDKQSVVTTSTTGASISVVSCGAATVSKNLDAGKTYTVTVKTAKKTFTTTFSVVDTQASASVNITKKTTTKTNAADILAETCEVTYDGKKLNNPTFVVNGNDCKTVGASTYIAKASVYVTNSRNITYTVPVTINTTFTR